MRNKNNLFFALGLTAFIALAIVYHQYNPAKYKFFPKCPFHLLTGLDCPGCGSQRAFFFLLHGDVAQAIRMNLLLVLSLPFLLIHFYFKVKTVITRKDQRWDVIYHPLTPKII